MATGGVPSDDLPEKVALKLRKSKVYDRAEITETLPNLEGMSFPAATDSKPARKKTTKSSKPSVVKKPPSAEQSPPSAELNPSEEASGEIRGEGEEFDLGDLPERLSDTAGLGNMPELTLLVEDDDVIRRFEDPETAKLLREISLDPSKLEELKSKPQIQWMLEKIEEKKWLIQTDPKYAQYRKTT